MVLTMLWSQLSKKYTIFYATWDANEKIYQHDNDSFIPISTAKHYLLQKVLIRRHKLGNLEPFVTWHHINTYAELIY